MSGQRQSPDAVVVPVVVVVEPSVVPKLVVVDGQTQGVGEEEEEEEEVGVVRAGHRVLRDGPVR